MATPTTAEYVDYRGYGQAFTPTADDMTERYYGVLVTTTEDAETAIALTGDTRRALAALNAYYRIECGFVNLLDDPEATVQKALGHLTRMHVVFTRPSDPDDDNSWYFTPVEPGTPHAVDIVQLHP